MAWMKDSTGRETNSGEKDSFIRELDKPTPPPAPASATATAPVEPARAVARERAEVRNDGKEALLAAGLTIEGKIEGTGHVRIAGNFKGDVNVQGNVTIEAGAHVTGQVHAQTVVIGGELQGNIEAASRVELLQTGLLNGDLKAGSLIVAAGSRMRGRAEFGWDEKTGGKTVQLGVANLPS
jgi:cytoskeletal protein CcmA (bactofilin family)